MSDPTIISGYWTIPKDPDDISFFRGNISQDLADRGTTAVSVAEIVAGVTVATPTAISVVAGVTWLIVKLSGLDVLNTPPVNFCTFRVTCANGEQFDRTIKFIREDH